MTPGILFTMLLRKDDMFIAGLPVPAHNRAARTSGSGLTIPHWENLQADASTNGKAGHRLFLLISESAQRRCIYTGPIASRQAIPTVWNNEGEDIFRPFHFSNPSCRPCVLPEQVLERL